MVSSNNSSVKKQYISIFICWLSYIVIYLARFSYTANIGLIETDYNVDHASAGLVMTFFSIAYGAGQIIHGLFCKKYPKRFLVSIALFISAFIDLFLFFGVPDFALIKYLWLLNALCQSLLWPTLMQVISENVSDKLMRTAILVMSTCTSVGTLLTYGISAALSEINYHLTFLVGTIVISLASILWLIFYSPGNYLKEAQNIDPDTSDSKKKFPYILIIPISLLLIFSIITNFAKDGLQTWVPVILKEIKHDLGDRFSILLTLVLPIFGIFGATVAVMLNKKIKKAIPLTMFFLGFTALFNTVVIIFQNNLTAVIITFGILELLLHGSANAIVSIFPLAMREKMSTGALTGILNGSAYVGSATSSYLLGKIADVTGGWSMVFITLLGVVCSALILGVIYLIISIKNPKLNV